MSTVVICDTFKNACDSAIEAGQIEADCTEKAVTVAVLKDDGGTRLITVQPNGHYTARETSGWVRGETVWCTPDVEAIYSR